jgi:hypothetical protein
MIESDLGFKLGIDLPVALSFDDNGKIIYYGGVTPDRRIG